MKEKLNKLRSKCVALAVATGLSLTGCSSSSENKKETHNIDDYYVLYVNEKPYLVNALTNLATSLSGVGTLNYYDINTDERIGRISPQYELDKNATFSNEIGSYITRFALIKLDELVDKDNISYETYKFFADCPEDVDKYIDKNYLYSVNYKQRYNGDTYTTKLGIYCFHNKLTGNDKYHIGYGANRLYECDYIYDIKDNKIYRKPDSGSCKFKPIDELYDDDYITANQAFEIMNNYIDKMNSKKGYQKKK